MSKLRPELCTHKAGSIPVLSTEDALYWIKRSVEQEAGLINGKLHGDGAHCAIGSYFARYCTALDNSLIDEVAMVNDMKPRERPASRRKRVLEWLQWKLDRLK